ncbi:MAG: hypothetical protein Q8O09_01510, partial [Bacillota bacterium]|nr:hypothetical protein [Bacillota bacterium]
SNMGYGYRIGHGYTETGILALVKIKRGEDGKVGIVDAGYMTTYCSKYKNKVGYLDSRGKTRYRTIKAYDILPAQDALSHPENYRGISKTTLRHLTVAAANSRKVVGKSAAKLMLFKLNEYQSYPWQ